MASTIPVSIPILLPFPLCDPPLSRFEPGLTSLPPAEHSNHLVFNQARERALTIFPPNTTTNSFPHVLCRSTRPLTRITASIPHIVRLHALIGTSMSLVPANLFADATTPPLPDLHLDLPLDLPRNFVHFTTPTIRFLLTPLVCTASTHGLLQHRHVGLVGELMKMLLLQQRASVRRPQHLQPLLRLAKSQRCARGYRYSSGLIQPSLPPTRRLSRPRWYPPAVLSAK